MLSRLGKLKLPNPEDYQLRSARVKGGRNESSLFLRESSPT